MCYGRTDGQKNKRGQGVSHDETKLLKLKSLEKVFLHYKGCGLKAVAYIYPVNTDFMAIN